MQLFKPKAQPCNSVVDFLNQEASSTLLSIAMKLLRIRYSDNGKSIKYFSQTDRKFVQVNPDLYCYILNSWDMYDFRTWFIHKVPRTINTNTTAEEILQVIENRGDEPNASFILGVINEFGLNEKLEENINAANYHYEIARKGECRLMPILDYLRKEKDIHKSYTNQNEYILINLGRILTEYYVTDCLIDLHIDDAIDKLTYTDRRILKRLATCGVVACQQRNYPLSILFTGSVVSRIVCKAEEKIFDADAFVFYISPEVANLIISSFVYKVQKMALEGNSTAESALPIAHLPQR